MKKLLIRLLNILTFNKFNSISRTSDEVFIIGDGNSLNNFDFRHIADNDIITLSLAPICNEFSEIPLKDKLVISLLTAPKWFFPYLPQVTGGGFWRNRINSKFLRVIKKLDIDYLFVSIWSIHVYAFRIKVFSLRNPLRLKGELDWSIGGLTYALFLAEKLGYKKVNLVGCDYLAEPAYAGHWFEKNKKIEVELDSYMEEYFNELDKEKFTVWTVEDLVRYNLPIVKLSGDMIFKKTLSEELMKDLSTWKDFEIF